MKLTKEARHWYRSAMVWFLTLAGVMQAVQMALPQVQDYLPSGVYDWITAACIVIAGVARFIRQPGMREAVRKDEVHID